MQFLKSDVSLHQAQIGADSSDAEIDECRMPGLWGQNWGALQEPYWRRNAGVSF